MEDFCVLKYSKSESFRALNCYGKNEGLLGPKFSKFESFLALEFQSVLMINLAINIFADGRQWKDETFAAVIIKNKRY